MNLTPDQIRDTAIVGLFENPRLMDLLTLKGGNALRLLGEAGRYSQDIDFSLPDQKILTQEDQQEIQRAIRESFDKKGFHILNYSFTEMPRNPSNDPRENLMGGYTISFSIIEKNKYQTIEHQSNKVASRRAYPLEHQQKKIKIDISKDEFVENRQTISYQSILIHIYSPLMVVYEKVRASCQQLPEYQRPKIRARDLYDIYNLLTSPHKSLLDLNEEVKSKKNIYILKEMFKKKAVDLILLTKLNEYHDQLAEDYQKSVLPQIRDDRNTGLSFEFVFSWCVALFNDLYRLAK